MSRAPLSLAGSLATLSFALAGCWTAPVGTVKLAPGDAGVRVPGLSSCHPDRGDIVSVDASRPLVVLVHGCSFSMGGFRTLADVLEAHGQQAICFNYNDRDRIEVASAQLIDALEALQRILRPGELTIVGHSQGGLVSRRAFVRERERQLQVRDGFSFRLVTISSPFAGIRASRHCGLTWLHVATLGATVAVCQAIAGDKWHEIPPGSEMTRAPGTLLTPVTSHLRIVTDERDTCRRRSATGACQESDFIFSRDEQRNAVVDDDERVDGLEVAAGHVEIVGEQGQAPTKLLDALRTHGILAAVPAERRAELALLITRLYE